MEYPRVYTIQTKRIEPISKQISVKNCNCSMKLPVKNIIHSKDIVKSDGIVSRCSDAGWSRVTHPNLSESNSPGPAPPCTSTSPPLLSASTHHLPSRHNGSCRSHRTGCNAQQSPPGALTRPANAKPPYSAAPLSRSTGPRFRPRSASAARPPLLSRTSRSATMTPAARSRSCPSSPRPSTSPTTAAS
jgi:hypothetical protein